MTNLVQKVKKLRFLICTFQQSHILFLSNDYGEFVHMEPTGNWVIPQLLK